MIPVIIGAALAAGAGVGFALGKNDKPKKVVVNNVIQKAEVSEDYVKWQLDRAGKNIETPSTPRRGSLSDMKFIPSGNFGADFEKIENMLASPNVSDKFISHALQMIENRATIDWNDQALNFVAYYREKLRNRGR